MSNKNNNSTINVCGDKNNENKNYRDIDNNNDDKSSNNNSNL